MPAQRLTPQNSAAANPQGGTGLQVPHTLYKRRKKMSKVQNGQNVSVHYVGTLEDGTKFDSSHDRGETLNFQVGSGQMITGFDKAVVGMTQGETKTFTLKPEDGYGVKNEEAIQEVEKINFPDGFNAEMGQTVTGQNQNGQNFNATIIAIQEDTVTLDFNDLPIAS